MDKDKRIAELEGALRKARAILMNDGYVAHAIIKTIDAALAHPKGME